MKSKNQHTILWYLIICFATSFILDLIFWTRDKGDHSPDNLIIYLPALTVAGLYLFKLRKPIFKSEELGLTLKGWKYWILVPLIVTALCLLSYGISIILNPGLLKNSGDIIYSLEESGFDFGHISLGLAVVALINAFLGGLVSIPIYLGQELGWRGFLMPRLLVILKPLPAFIVGGMTWGIWSFLFLKCFHNGSANPLAGWLLTISMCIPLGIIFQYLFFKTHSIFVAVLAHGALNKSIDTATLFLSHEEMNAQIFGPFGIAGIAVIWVMAGILFNKINWQTKNIYHENTI